MKRDLSMRCLPLLLLLVAHGVLAQAISGRVVSVADGDTLTVLDSSKRQHRIRLADIDAPEKGQAFGKRSRQSLSDICAGKGADVVGRGKDRYGRTIGIVTCATVEANREQVRRGLAWVFVRYAPAGSPLYALEVIARRQRMGLWVDSHPVAPWDWRAARRGPTDVPKYTPAGKTEDK